MKAIRNFFRSKFPAYALQFGFVHYGVNEGKTNRQKRREELRK